MLHRYLCVLLAALFLVPAALAQRATDEAQVHLQRNAFRYGLTAADLADLVVTDAYASRRSGTTHVYLRQRKNGIEIAEANFTVAVGRDGRVIHAAGQGAPDLAEQRAASSPAISAEAAADALARAMGLTPTEPFRVLSTTAGRERTATLSTGGVAAEPLAARIVYHLDDAGQLALAWEVQLYETSAQHYWVGYVDAAAANVLSYHDLVVHDTFGMRPADGARATEAHAVDAAAVDAAAVAPSYAPYALAGSYRVYEMPVESPIHTSPLPPADGRTLAVDPDDAMASPFGWHDTDGAAGAEYTITRGNNVHAYLDRIDDGIPDPNGSPDGGPGLVFDFPIDLTQGPSAYSPAAVTNLFYWNNVFHDILWHNGFDEAAGNFQVNNYGNGGLGNDDVRAEAQDGADQCGSFFCLNNANFLTLPDGQRPRMQMYEWTETTPRRDGDIDNGIVLHEYGHGVSKRLTGGPGNTSCLTNSEQMGEGWSDYFSVLLTMKPGDTRTTGRGVGNYALGFAPDGPGIREYPYHTDFAVNPQTYGFTRTAIVPHGVGSVWTMILWEATWDMVDVYGFDPDLYVTNGSAGNQVMMALIIEAMKMMPCSPGFIDGRNAILAADQALYGGAHIDVLWAGFARRGLGIGADQGSVNTNSDNVEDFAEPEQIPPDPVTDLAAAPASLGIELTWTATGDDGSVGTASIYDIRYSTTGPITTDAAFDAAAQADGEPTPQVSGSTETFAVTGLNFATQYWFALKVTDNSFNTSDLSNSASATTLTPPVAGVNPSSVQAQAQSGQQTTATVTISNSGASDLLYGIDLSETGAQRSAPVTERAAAPTQRETPEVKDAPEARGTPQECGSGGPDLFGYTWIDSDEPGGPTYSWIDISTTGTDLDLSDDDGETVALPFTFEFYGTDHTTVDVSSNGYLTFGTDRTDYTNDPIPDVVNPNDYIGVYWDDLDPGNSGSPARVVYQNMGDGRLVVSWLDVPHFPDDGSFTFQAVLYASGQMLFQYEEIAPEPGAGDENSATVGLENADASDGLQIVYNAPYVHDGLAVRISALWVSAAPSAGTVASGGSDEVTLTFDAAGLEDGTYTADMTVATNDPNNPIVVVPITFTVGAGSGVVVSVVPDNPPAIVQPGESDSFTATLTVPASGPSSFDVWFDVTEPSGITRTIHGPYTVSVTPGTTASQSITRRVAGGAPLGDYTYTMNVGTFPGTIVATDGFPFTVVAAKGMTQRAAADDETWALYVDGALLADGSTLDLRTAPEALAAASAGSELPEETALHVPYPNPFGVQTTVRYDLAQAGAVRLAVYDLLGREVAVLAEGDHEPGRFAATLDGEALSNGVYLVRMSAPGFAQTWRITLLR